MSIVRPGVLLAIVFFVAAPARAQTEDWAREIERQVSRHADALVRIVEAQIARAQARGLDRAQRNRAEATETFSRRVRLARNGTLDLQNVAGDIVVTGGGGDDVRIDAVKRARGATDAAARGLLQQIRIRVEDRAGTIEVRTEYPRRLNVPASVEYTVTVPNSANVTLRTVSGGVRVSNLRGELRAESVSGDVVASSVRQVRALRSVSGTLQVSDAEGGELEAATISGDVVLTDARPRSVEVNTVTGNVRFTNLQSDRASVRSMSGNIDYAGRLARSGRYELRTHSGNLRVTPAGDGGFDVEASTFGGNVRSDYALEGFQSNLANGFRRGVNRTVRGTFGDAAAALVLESFSGNITLIRR